jgi:hypothetical protein
VALYTHTEIWNSEFKIFIFGSTEEILQQIKIMGSLQVRPISPNGARHVPFVIKNAAQVFNRLKNEKESSYEMVFLNLYLTKSQYYLHK